MYFKSHDKIIFLLLIIFCLVFVAACRNEKATTKKIVSEDLKNYLQKRAKSPLL